MKKDEFCIKCDELFAKNDELWKELPFFAELRFPLLQKAVCSHLKLKTVAAVSTNDECVVTKRGILY